MPKKKSKLRKALSPDSSTVQSDTALDENDLMDDLFAQLDSEDSTVRGESASVIQEINSNATSPPKKDSKSRFIARQAKKAAALVESYGQDDPQAEARRQAAIKNEETSIAKTCKDLDVEIYEIEPDGHCLFSAVADQLLLLNLLPSTKAAYPATRASAASYMLTHPEEFLPFLPSQRGGDVMTEPEFTAYCASIQNTGIWGGEHEILALARAFNTPIHVIQAPDPQVVVHNPTSDASNLKKVIRISYHRFSYGLGEHYNSLRPKSALKSALSNMVQSVSSI
ncbi:OTU-domain-containing protein [Flagelloscypha sp. PMI_526]|nr:OTU-domain-containing protein [Flagelloscypha sp. PMI_526]